MDEQLRARLEEIFPPGGQSRQAVAKALGISLGAVAHYFAGRRKITVDTLLAMKGAAPDISLDWLLTGEEHEGSGDSPRPVGMDVVRDLLERLEPDQRGIAVEIFRATIDALASKKPPAPRHRRK